MAGPDPRLQAEEAGFWIGRADQDIAAAVRVIADEPPLTDIAAYHCQQATEKILKAALILAAIRPRKTHDLAQLADEVAVPYPTLASLAAPLRTRTAWVHAFRYPVLHDDAEPLPDVEDIERVLAQVASHRTAVIQLIEAAS